MPNLFSSINLDASKTAASTFDLKVLDTPCNHQILNEEVEFDSTNIFNGVVYSGESFYSGGDFYSGDINSEASVLIMTKFPLNDKNVEIFEVPSSDKNNLFVQEFSIDPDLTTDYRLIFPPVPNSVKAKLKTTNIDEFGETQVVYFDFVNYTLSQLFGIIRFNSTSDITTPASIVQFSYIADQKQIFQKTKDNSPNWEFVGYHQSGKGIFRIYGRAFTSTLSGLKIRYKTISNSCPKCGGKNVSTDLHFNDNKNNLYLVYDFSKLIQDFFKRFLTSRGSNPFHTTEGTQIPIYVGLGKNNPLFIDTSIRNEVVKLVNVIRSKQNTQLVVQGLSLAEQLGQINQLLVTREGVSDINITIEMQSLSKGTAQIQTTIRG